MANWDIFKWIFNPNRVSKIEILRTKFSWPDAEKDRCTECGTIRVYHDKKLHRFKEK